MAIKDKLVSWYIKNYLIPRAQIFDKSGFVIFKISGKTNIYSRQVIMPESFYSNIETALIERMGKQGKVLLYNAGKKFGWRFATVSNVTTINEVSEKKFAAYISNLFKFIEGTYASEIIHTLDLKKEMIQYTTRNFIICEKSGEGYFLSAGGAGGLWAKLINNPKVEGIHTRCQGRGAKDCLITCAPPEILKTYGDEIFIETDISGLELAPDYEKINTIIPTKFSSKTFQDLLKANLFTYKKGIIMRGAERYFVVETSSIYLIERELQKDKQALEILHKTSQKTGQEMLKSFSISSIGGIMDLLTAFGWGDVLIIKKGKGINVSLKYYPWTRFVEDIEFIALRGLLEGILSGFFKNEVQLELNNKKVSAGGVTLEFSST